MQIPFTPGARPGPRFIVQSSDKRRSFQNLLGENPMGEEFGAGVLTLTVEYSKIAFRFSSDMRASLNHCFVGFVQ